MRGAREQDAERRAFRTWPETCPVIDEILDDITTEPVRSIDYAITRATSRIKAEVTVPMRKALIAAHQEVLDMQAERDEAQELLEEAEKRIDELKQENYELTAEVEGLRERVDAHITLTEG